MRKSKAFWLLLCVLLISMGCNSGTGKDSISSLSANGNGQTGYSTSADCLVCHSSQSSASLDPQSTNGTGTAGKHVLHVKKRGIGCLTCHAQYRSEATHMNGALDTAQPAAHLVSFDAVNPGGVWNDEKGSCSNLACHGPERPEWYRDGEDLPDCSTCHTGNLDPLRTNGADTSGKHILHVTGRGIACTRCHLAYPDQMTHMNGTKDTANPAIGIVLFDTLNPGAQWVDDLGANRGRCSAVVCHGAETPDWYRTGENLPECSVCHIGTYDPTVTNSQGSLGKHIIHVNNRSIGCAECHLNYTDQLTHMSGTWDTKNPAVSLVRFDSTNPNGQWTGDNGANQGRCSTVACHGAETPDWYRQNDDLPECTVCHQGAYDPLITNGVDAAGKHVLHVTTRGIGCTKCHLDYKDRATHMNGVKEAGNPAYNIVLFDSTNAVGQWIDDTAAGQGKCSALACHGPEIPDWYRIGSALPDCSTCHSGSLNPVTLDALLGRGKHQKHSAYACLKCHNAYTVYLTHMNGTLNAENPAIRIVYFDASNPSGRWMNPYEEQTCSSIYCHSDGTSVATGVIPDRESPAWPMGATACGVCHGQNWQYTDAKRAMPLYANDNPKSNTHERHVSFPCNYCHYATTTNGTSITNSANHGNGVYNVIPDPTQTVTLSGVTTTINFNYAFNSGGGSCTNTSCHTARGLNPNLHWGAVAGGITGVQGLCNSGEGCYEVVCSAQVTGGTPPYTYTWDFLDGTILSGAGLWAVGHSYSSFGGHSVSVTVYDANHHWAQTTIGAYAQESRNVIPVADKIVTVNGRTVTVTDMSYDPDYNYCGHSGPGTVLVWWGTGLYIDQRETYFVDFTDSPSHYTMSHTYTEPGTYTIVHEIRDNEYNYPLGTDVRSPIISVTIP